MCVCQCDSRKLRDVPYGGLRLVSVKQKDGFPTLFETLFFVQSHTDSFLRRVLEKGDIDKLDTKEGRLTVVDVFTKESRGE
jgi:hypothetical protein